MDAFDVGYALQDMPVAKVLEALIDEKPDLKMSETALWRRLGVSDAMREVAQYAAKSCTLLMALQKSAARHEPALLRLASVLAAPVALYQRIAQMGNVPVEPASECAQLPLEEQFQAIEQSYAQAGMYQVALVWQQVRMSGFAQNPKLELQAVRLLQSAYRQEVRQAAPCAR